MRQFFFTLLLLTPSLALRAQFAPPAGQAGSTAMHKDSSAFKAWASTCTVTRGLRDIAVPDSGYASAGTETMATGPAGEGGVISLGDGGMAVLYFPEGIKNLPGPDFAIFENGFEDRFLELAFVEVSSDGLSYSRFPASSLTQDTVQTQSFGYTDAVKLNNLAGKYRALYGTPFELEELKNKSDVDVMNIHYVRIVDVVGTINPSYATRDKDGHIINDPYPTNFPSSGFDLDGVGVIHPISTGIANLQPKKMLCYPNPARQEMYLKGSFEGNYTILDLSGRILQQGRIELSGRIDIQQLAAGCYQLILVEGSSRVQTVFVKTDE